MFSYLGPSIHILRISMWRYLLDFQTVGPTRLLYLVDSVPDALDAVITDN